MDAWIKILVVMIMFSALGMIMPFLLIDPFVGLILLGVILTLLVLTLEPATGKAMAQVTVPLVIILFVFQVWVSPEFIFNNWMLLVVFAVMYLMFTMFTGGSSFVEGGFIDAKVSLKLFPLYGVAIFLSVLIDETRHLTAYIMAGTIFCLMVLYFAFLRNYDKWPTYSQFKYADIEAVTDLNPKGKVKTGAEIWWARTDGPPIKAGEKVVIDHITGITMHVRRPDDISSSDQ
ncbi:MAG: NfeD family protein [Candidatus Thorarchaeota archaeon]|jgi:membrane-bound ClpP family serine protease